MEPFTLNTASFFKRASSVADHYGFVGTHTILSPEECSAEQSKSSNPLTHGHVPHMLRHYIKTGAKKNRQPLLFYTPSIVSHPAEPHQRLSALTLSATGVHDPLTEFTLLKTTLGILDEFGIRNVLLRVNSIGDHDSMARFMREAQARMREKLPYLEKEHVQAFKTNAQQTISALFTARHESVADIPAPINFLTTPSRKYFRDFLSLLEYAELPVELDDRLYGDHSMYTHTLYEIYTRHKNGAEYLVARGGRYDPLTKQHVRNVVPTAGIAIICKTADTQFATPRHRRNRKPQACIVHIGREAHIKSIALVDAFRKAKLPVSQCFHLDRFSDQVAYAETQNPKYVLIIGQKEAIQNTAIVRDTATSSQITIPIAKVPMYLREHAC